MKKIIYILILLISYSGFSQKSALPDNQNQVLFYGLMTFHRIKAMEFAAEKYEIEVKGVAGCMVSRKLVDSVKTVHIGLWKRMDSIYGIGAKERYEKSVDFELEQIQKASDIIKDKRDIKKVLRIIKRENEASSISLQGKLDENLYYWNIYSLNREKYPNKLWHPEYKIIIDLKKEEYKIERIE
ncbi:hypothetical protein [Flagellimonas sp.]|uniref:hypothetical protein n=1 Tax=Flagellimonas sp. TaxID=2058762 RepID=UPI003B52F1D5